MKRATARHTHSGKTAKSDLAPAEPKADSRIRFRAKLCRPADQGTSCTWTFLNLPKSASERLPSRAMVTVRGTFADLPFQATLEPDGKGGHWLKVEKKLRQQAGLAVGEVVSLDIEPVADEPEPDVPTDLRQALAAAEPRVRDTWADITPLARRDWIQWIISGKRAETRTKRIATACDMLAKGKRRPCCFDRSGMYSNSLACPVPAEDDLPPNRERRRHS